MELDIIFTIGTVIAAASVLVAVISGLRADMCDMRADMRDMRTDIRAIQTEMHANAAAIGEFRGLLTAHITGHSHSVSEIAAKE